MITSFVWSDCPRFLLATIAVCLGALFPAAGWADDSEPTVGRSRFQHELEDAEILMFRGQYDEAFRRSEYARDSLRREGGMEKMLLDAIVDVLQAEIRAAQGYFTTAQTLLKGANKTLDQKAAWWAQRGASVNDLKAFNFRRGYIKLLLGDVALAEARIQSILEDRGDVLRRCKPYYEDGIAIMRDTWSKTDGEGLNVQVRLMHRSDLREVLMLILENDLSRAQSIYDEVERFIFEKDPEWRRLFHPDGEAGAALQANQPGGKSNVPAGNPSQAAASQPAAPANAEAATLTGEQLRLKASQQARNAVRVALLYIELLSVKAKLYLAKKDMAVAEEAAALARDIAEEKFPEGGSHRIAMLELADVYLACREREAEEARRNRDAVFEFDGKTVNIHTKAAESYLADAEELLTLVEKESVNLNPSQPVHFLAADLRRKIAAVRKDPSGVSAAERELSRLADARKQDKPKPPR
jgi:hypothetical protein